MFGWAHVLKLLLLLTAVLAIIFVLALQQPASKDQATVQQALSFDDTWHERTNTIPIIVKAVVTERIIPPGFAPPVGVPSVAVAPAEPDKPAEMRRGRRVKRELSAPNHPLCARHKMQQVWHGNSWRCRRLFD